MVPKLFASCLLTIDTKDLTKKLIKGLQVKTTIFFEDAKTGAKFDSKASGVVVEQKFLVRPTTLGFCIPVVAKAFKKTRVKIKRSVMKEEVEEKHLKAGRPLKTVKRDIRAAVRFSKTEYFIVQTKAGKAGLTVSESLLSLFFKFLPG